MDSRGDRNAMQFDVLIEDRVVLPEYRPISSGQGVPQAHSFPVSVADSALDLSFYVRNGSPQIAAIEVEKE
jgi:hypothetical protein